MYIAFAISSDFPSPQTPTKSSALCSEFPSHFAFAQLSGYCSNNYRYLLRILHRSIWSDPHTLSDTIITDSVWSVMGYSLCTRLEVSEWLIFCWLSCLVYFFCLLFSSQMTCNFPNYSCSLQSKTRHSFSPMPLKMQSKKYKYFW